MKRICLAILLALVGCRSQGLAFDCTSDAQCGGAGICINGGCAFPADCPSGYRWDRSAPTGSGECVPVNDMGIAPSGDDMSSPSEDIAQPAIPDMVMPNDLTLTCAMQSQPCTVGVGACARTGTVVCSAQNVASCTATPGAPDTSGTWHMAAAVNGSWDWDCDGAIEYQYPSGDTMPPPRDTDPNAVTDCTTIGVQSVCIQQHWYYILWNHWPDSCGHAIDTPLCYWNVNACASSGGNETTEGCR